MGGIDLGLDGRRALVCGSSSGIGRGCATALVQAGATVTLNGRSEERLVAAVDAIEGATGVTVDFIAADVQTAVGRSEILSAVPNADILVNNAAGPPTGDFREFDEQAWHEAVEMTMISPVMMIRGVIDGMIEREWGRIVNLTSSAVKAPLPLLGLSNGARSGLTGFVAGISREVAASGVTINNLLPGRIETERLASYIGKVAKSQGISYEEAAQAMAAANPMKRFGTPEEMGAICAFLCSAQAAYVTGQNILVDGGEYPGL